MNKVQILLSAIVMMVALPVLAQTHAFAPNLPDVPLMEGMSAVENSDYAFDTPTLRVAEITYKTQTTPQSIRAYYNKALPQLGWQQVGPRTFKRHKETLTYDVDHKPPLGVFVTFSVSPDL